MLLLEYDVAWIFPKTVTNIPWSRGLGFPGQCHWREMDPEESQPSQTWGNERSSFSHPSVHRPCWLNAPQFLQWKGGHINTINQHRSILQLHHAEQGLKQTGLAGTSPSHYTNLNAGIYQRSQDCGHNKFCWLLQAASPTSKVCNKQTYIYKQTNKKCFGGTEIHTTPFQQAWWLVKPPSMLGGDPLCSRRGRESYKAIYWDTMSVTPMD